MNKNSELLPLRNRFEHKGQQVAWGVIGAGPPIVLVHGFPWSAQAWRKIAPWLAKSHTVYYFDMIGCGHSDKGSEQNVSERVQSDLVEALIAHWALEKPSMVGHDFGGLAVLRAHFINGVDYGALFLIDPVAILPSGSPFYEHVRQHESAFAGLPSYAHEALFEAYIQKAAHHRLRHDAREIYSAPWSGDIGQAAFYRQIAQSDTENIAETQKLYKKRSFPVHLIWGEHDSFIPINQGHELTELLEADSFSVISNAAHIVQEDAPEALLGAVLTNT